MTGVVLINARSKFTNASGVPIAGGSVAVYLAGTTTLATTYQDQALTSANTNPITLDANGECLLWVDAAYTYKILLKDALGATVSGYPVDNLPGAIGAGSSGALSFLQAGTGAVSRTAQNKMREWVSVTDYLASGAATHSAAAQKAIDYLATVGGGVVYFPPGQEYVADVAGATDTLIITGDNIHLHCHGARLKNFRFNWSSAAQDCGIQGGYIYDDTGTNTRFFIDFSGDGLLLRDVKFEFINHLQALGYTRRNANNVTFDNVTAIKGGLNILGGGHDYHFINCHWIDGTDDAIAVKAAATTDAAFDTYNISVVGGSCKNHAAMLSIGSEIGVAGITNTNKAKVRNVVMSGVTGYECGNILFIKPGAVALDYRNGLVENVSVSNCSLYDATGAKYKRAFDIQAGRGATVNGVTIINCVVRARCLDLASNNSFIFFKTGAAGDPATIKNVSISDCVLVDLYDGVANSASEPGHPTLFVCTTEGSDTVENISLRNLIARGTRDGGIFTTDIVNLRVENVELQKIAAAPAATYSGLFNDAAGTTFVKNFKCEALNGYAVGIGTAAGQAFAPEGDVAICHIGSRAAGANLDIPLWAPPRSSYVWKAEIVNGATIAQSNVDYTSLTLRNFSTTGSPGAGNTTTTGMSVTALERERLTSVSYTNSHAFVTAASALALEKRDTGTGKALTDAYAVIHYVPYG